MGAIYVNVHALLKLHRIWKSRHRTLSRLYQRAKTVSMNVSYFFLNTEFYYKPSTSVAQLDNVNALINVKDI